ncbi:MAG TPA: NYN domain-containing protein [Candidatus Limnocylindrales bacterium]|nr:NYN domain-containing protein [Candidatus Limnocylindrales bacterium]
MSKNVAVFVDVANIFYAAKAAGVDIDYVTLLKSASAGRDLVRAYAYTGLDPDNENQRNFHSFLARNGYRVVSKDIRKYGDGKVKANLDIELVVDMMKTARNLDIAIVVSGDGDFAPAIRAVQEMGVRVEVISFRGNTSSDLMDVADQFTDITALARVEKGSSRSGRRVAGDDEDLSMTEVPDKQTEGTGAGRGRGRGRGRTRTSEPEPVAASRGSRASRTAAVAATNGGAIVALPGEKLSRVAAPIEDDEASPAADDEVGSEGGELGDEAGRRRRRRRGGRGRGRGRGRTDEPMMGDEAAGEEPTVRAAEVEPAVARGPRPTPFGSVWDSQLGGGRPMAPAAGLEPLDDEDFDEPEIPEYLIAEQRRGRAGGGAGRGTGRGGARGGRSAYSAAVDRERYGRGGGGGGINRYPDVGARDRDRDRPRSEPFVRRDRPTGPPRGGGGSEPWSEVPPELEAMLRAQIASKPRPAPTPTSPPVTSDMTEAAAPAVSDEPAPATKRRTTRRTAVTSTSAVSEATESPASATPDGAAAAPKRRTTRRTTTTAKAGSAGATESAAAPTPDDAAPTPKRRTTRRTTPAADSDASPDVAASSAEETAAPKRRATRRRAASPEGETA